MYVNVELHHIQEGARSETECPVALALVDAMAERGGTSAGANGRYLRVHYKDRGYEADYYRCPRSVLRFMAAFDGYGRKSTIKPFRFRLIARSGPSSHRLEK